MKKILNISLLLLGLGLSCSLGCRSWLGPKEPSVKAEPGLGAGDYIEARTATKRPPTSPDLTAGEYLEARTGRAPTSAPVRTTPAPTAARRAA